MKMIMRVNFLISGIIFGILIQSCTTKTVDLEKLRQEVVETEKAFNDHAAVEGLKSAFMAYADEEAVLNRRGRVIKGKEAIGAYFDGFDYESVSLTWKPDFVEVAEAGDMAYTYGLFEFVSTDSLGVEQRSQGVFHTIWKKQTDGSWRYVWD
jgi:ketosteroid isomerase-like protein